MANRIKRDPGGRFAAGKGNGKGVTPEKMLEVASAFRILSELTTRSEIAAKLGKSFSGDRDIYAALGYTKLLEFDHYMARYKRQDIARAIIDAPANACWRNPPRIIESDDENVTPFEAKWDEMTKRLNLYRYLKRVDRLAGIGNYAAMLLGFGDGAPLEVEVTGGRDLMYVQTFSQKNAEIAEYDEDPLSERYALPKLYKLTTAIGEKKATQRVHWTRVLHVAEDTLEDDVFGVPRLEAVYNRLQDLDLVTGGSAEMFWRGGFPGIGFEVNEGAKLEKQDLVDLQSEVEDYIHGLKRYLRLQGMKATTLDQQIADPTGQVGVLIDLIAAATRIPKRILLGSERGELASTQDEENWARRVEERQRDHCELGIIRPLISRLVLVRIMTDPGIEGYTVDWPTITPEGADEKAKIGQMKASALAAYVGAAGADTIVPPEVFLRSMLGFTDDEITQIEVILAGVMADEGASGADMGGEPQSPIEPEGGETLPASGERAAEVPAGE